MNDTAVDCWVFDVDGCMVDSLTGSSLRPGARELLLHLRHELRTVIWWSAGGDDYARRRAAQLGVEDLVDRFYGKDERDDHGRYRTVHFREPLQAAIFVDDRPEDLPIGAAIIPVAPYLVGNPHDRGLLPVAQRAGVRTRPPA
jgi:long-chain acyl-CoA synthetase